MKKHNCQDIEPLLPATAAGALDAGEQIEIHEHLARCGLCIRKLHEYEETVVQLAYAVPQVAPPAALRSHIVQAVASYDARAGAAAAPFQPRAGGIPEPRAAAPAQSGSLAGVLGRLYGRLAPAALALSVVMLFFSGTALLNMSLQMDGMRDTVLEAQQMRQVLAVDGAIRAELAPKAGADKASGQVIMAPGQKHVVVVANHLPTPAPGETYRLWILHRDQPPVAAGKVKVDGNGVAMCTVEVPEDPAQADGMALSEEPENGGEMPAGTPVLEGWYK